MGVDVHWRPGSARKTITRAFKGGLLTSSPSSGAFAIPARSRQVLCDDGEMPSTAPKRPQAVRPWICDGPYGSPTPASRLAEGAQSSGGQQHHHAAGDNVGLRENL